LAFLLAGGTIQSTHHPDRNPSSGGTSPKYYVARCSFLQEEKGWCYACTSRRRWRQMLILREQEYFDFVLFKVLLGHLTFELCSLVT